MDGKAYHEFHVGGEKVLGVGYRPYISDVLYNMDLPGRPVNDYANNQAYVGVYGPKDKVMEVHGYLKKHHPEDAKVAEITKPVKTAEPEHEIPRNLNDMHVYATHLSLGQMNTFVHEAKQIKGQLKKLDQLEGMNTKLDGMNTKLGKLDVMNTKLDVMNTKLDKLDKLDDLAVGFHELANVLKQKFGAKN